MQYSTSWNEKKFGHSRSKPTLFPKGERIAHCPIESYREYQHLMRKLAVQHSCSGQQKQDSQRDWSFELKCRLKWPSWESWHLHCGRQQPSNCHPQTRQPIRMNYCHSHYIQIQLLFRSRHSHHAWRYESEGYLWKRLGIGHPRSHPNEKLEL